MNFMYEHIYWYILLWNIIKSPTGIRSHRPHAIRSHTYTEDDVMVMIGAFKTDNSQAETAETVNKKKSMPCHEAWR